MQIKGGALAEGLSEGQVESAVEGLMSASIGDLMYAFAQWLKHTPIADLAWWLGNTPANRLVDSNIWIAPVVQTIHILAIAMTVASVLMVSLRIFDVAGRSRTLAQTVARYLPWIWWGLVVLLATGLILVIGEPARELLNPSFWSKMIALLIAIGISLAFQETVRRHSDRWEPTAGGTLIMRGGAVAVLVLWCLIILFGRWIAYAAT
jgi:hypothetical protein